MTKQEKLNKLQQAMDLLLEVEKEYKSGPSVVRRFTYEARNYTTMALNEARDED